MCRKTPECCFYKVRNFVTQISLEVGLLKLWNLLGSMCYLGVRRMDTFGFRPGSSPTPLTREW